MAEEVFVRLFYTPACSGGCCGCGPDKNLLVFQGMAEELAEKFDDKPVVFEAYNTLDAKKFPFLKGQKAPVLAVDKVIVSSGKMPQATSVESSIKKALA
jgi:hypothetical protein